MGPQDAEPNRDESPTQGANPFYALGQLAAALQASLAHPDYAVRDRAKDKASDWRKVFQGMLSGALRVGSRVPIADVPAWATLKVIKGGFATGGLLAGDELQTHETTLLAQLADGSEPSIGQESARARLNSYYLTEGGLSDLLQMLASGRYRIEVPEEGALLTVAWLIAHDQADAADAVLAEIGPYMDRLRFYPVPHARYIPYDAPVHLETVGQVIENLRAIKLSNPLLAQRESVLVWDPLYDRAAALFLETVEGEPPSLQVGVDGKPIRSVDGRFAVEGGWPCQRYPDGWQARARELLEEYRGARQVHRACQKPERRGENFTLLRGFLETCVGDPKRLSGRDVGMIRSILAHVAAKRGAPGSERIQTLRARQNVLASQPTRLNYARMAIERLAVLPQNDGASAIDELLTPVASHEAEEYGLPSGSAIPRWLRKKVRRCDLTSIDALLAFGLIPSSETLARVVPQLTAHALAESIADPDLRRLYAAIYQAFRRRRSLLLLNLEKQVQLRELPWVRTIDANCREGHAEEAGRAAARSVMEKVATLAVTRYPQQILPNKLLQELRALASSAGADITLVDEVAADIFMGVFTDKYLRAAQTAATLLQGTLYERYYNLPYEQVLQINESSPVGRGQAPVSNAFSELCSQLAGPAATMGTSYVAQRGVIIEQEQILTTHNLAALFTTLGLRDSLDARLPTLARGCFIWICRRLQNNRGSWHSKLRAVKNAAYAWRQMLFFLALLPENDAAQFAVWASERLQGQSPEFQERFEPAFRGLQRAISGLPVESVDEFDTALSSCRFLGWTTQPHWLLAPTGRYSSESSGLQ